MEHPPQEKPGRTNHGPHTDAVARTPWHVAQTMQGGGIPKEPTTPFSGNIRGTTWNSQAFFANEQHKHHEKWSYLEKLLDKHDWVALTETHSTKGEVAAKAISDAYAAKCSHFNSKATAGLGLVIKNKFLEQFYALKDDDWEEIVEGRIARLTLKVVPHFWHSRQSRKAGVYPESRQSNQGQE